MFVEITGKENSKVQNEFSLSDYQGEWIKISGIKTKSAKEYSEDITLGSENFDIPNNSIIRLESARKGSGYNLVVMHDFVVDDDNICIYPLTYKQADSLVVKDPKKMYCEKIVFSVD